MDSTAQEILLETALVLVRELPKYGLQSDLVKIGYCSTNHCPRLTVEISDDNLLLSCVIVHVVELKQELFSVHTVTDTPNAHASIVVLGKILSKVGL
jgi:hypothetical protein